MFMGVGRRATSSGHARRVRRLIGHPNPPISAASATHDRDIEVAQNAQSDSGTTTEVGEPAGPWGDHLHLQNERLTGEPV